MQEDMDSSLEKGKMGGDIQTGMSDGSLVFFSLWRESVGYGTYVVKDHNQPLCFMNPVEETVTECITVLECCSNEMIFQLLRNESASERAFGDVPLGIHLVSFLKELQFH